MLEELRAEMPDATHHCSAWRIASPSIDRALDDGEPSGSAGRPILSQLTGRDLVDTIVIVTRYYGGTKLGVGGLVRAYGSAAAAVLDTLTPIPHLQTTTLTLEYTYADANAVDHVLTQHNIPLTPPTFTETIQRTIQAPLPTASPPTSPNQRHRRPNQTERNFGDVVRVAFAKRANATRTTSPKLRSAGSGVGGFGGEDAAQEVQDGSDAGGGDEVAVDGLPDDAGFWGAGDWGADEGGVGVGDLDGEHGDAETSLGGGDDRGDAVGAHHDRGVADVLGEPSVLATELLGVGEEDDAVAVEVARRHAELLDVFGRCVQAEVDREELLDDEVLLSGTRETKRDVCFTAGEVDLAVGADEVEHDARGSGGETSRDMAR